MSEQKHMLSQLSKREDLNNKLCNDCNNPNPQWASLSFAVFICLQCAGTHRGFGVHISFVRSISMDTWQDDQLKRMQLGGNRPFREFIRSYEPVDQGGYKDGLSPYDTYHSWAAAQYRDKLDAMLAGRDWNPSAPPPSFRSQSPSVGSSSQGLRKSRASTRTLDSRSGSQSPSSFHNSPSATTNLPSDQKTLNESYFASLGRANDTRPVDVPPSQGGRYQGFGNTPSPQPNQNPAFGLSSAAAPTLTDLQENPMAALSKGWSLFSTAVVGATKVVSENVIKPGVEKVTDPNFQASVKGYMTEAQKRAAVVGTSANQWSKHQFGVDVAESVGSVVGTVRDTVTGGPARQGYGSLAASSPNGPDETSGLYDGDDDFFEENTYAQTKSTNQSNTFTSATKSSTTNPKNDNWDDEWKDF